MGDDTDLEFFAGMQSEQPGEEPDWSPGDVIYAYPDGTIILDDGITTWNPERAAEWLRKN